MYKIRKTLTNLAIIALIISANLVQNGDEITTRKAVDINKKHNTGIINKNKDEHNEISKLAPSKTLNNKTFPSIRLQEYIYNNEIEHLNDFASNMTVSAFTNQRESINLAEDNGTVINFPYKGNYSISGDIYDLKSEYIQNYNGEQEASFYSANANSWGIPLQNIQDNTSNRHFWRYYADISTPIQQTIYSDTLDLYSTKNLEISYDLLLEKNSTLSFVENSSLIFDFIFDNCRFMIYNWRYSNVELPFGENETIPDVIFRINANKTWNDVWYHITVNVSNLLETFDLEYPTQLKSFGIIIESPTPSKISLLLDNITVSSEIKPSDIDLRLNGETVNENITGYFVNYTIHTSKDNNSRGFYWYYNSKYTIAGYSRIFICGIVSLPTNNTVSIYNSTIEYIIENKKISESIYKLNVTYPTLWEFVDINSEYLLIFMENTSKFMTTRGYAVNDKTPLFRVTFSIPNALASATFTKNIFERLEIKIGFDLNTKVECKIFWWNEITIGNASTTINGDKIEYLFPNDLANGSYNICIVLSGLNTIGIINSSIKLERYPADLLLRDRIVIPKYAYTEVPLEYKSLLDNTTINDISLTAKLLNNKIATEYSNGRWYILVSAFYLTEGEYNIVVSANASSFATVKKIVKLIVENSSLELKYAAHLSNVGSVYNFNFTLLASSFPVAYAPIIVNIKNDTYMGLTDRKGMYYLSTTIYPTSDNIEIKCNILQENNIIFTKIFNITFEIAEASIKMLTPNIIPNTNISLEFLVNYPFYNLKWYIELDQAMLPILNAYIETKDFTLPVYHDNNRLYWDVPEGYSLTGHKLIIETSGITLQCSFEHNEKPIIHFIFSSKGKTFQDINILYYHNLTLNPNDYYWKLFNPNSVDITERYNFKINSAYIILQNVTIMKNSYLIFDAVGYKILSNSSHQNMKLIVSATVGTVVPIISVLTGVRIYKKKKSMILEI